MCGITDDDKCYFCREDVETIEHLLFFCPIVKDFWVKLSEKMKPYLDITSNLSPQNVLLGCLDSKNKMCLNHLFSIVKRYIYSTKYNGKNLSLEYLVRIFRQHYLIESNLVHMCNKNAETFRNKWRPIEPMLVL